jgi:hypothetical protein
VSIVVIVVAIVIANVVDFHGYPSSLHKCPHPSVDAFQPLETLYHGTNNLVTFFPFLALINVMALLLLK